MNPGWNPNAAQQRFEQSVEARLDELLVKIGSPYVSRRQVKVTALHWPDVVWFETKLPKRLFLGDLRWGIPVVGFEIESSSSAQSIKAAINNLEALRPALGCIVIPKAVAERKRADRFGSRYVGMTAKAAVEYLAKRSWLSIAVLTDEQIQDFLTGRDLTREQEEIDIAFPQMLRALTDPITNPTEDAVQLPGSPGDSGA